MLEIQCAWCGVDFEIERKEYDRWIRRGRQSFYCSISCGAKSSNAPRRRRPTEKKCPRCGVVFMSDTGSKRGEHCSRSCASLASVTEKRRAAARCSGKKSGSWKKNFAVNLTAKGLRHRESWKYDLLQKLLEAAKEEFVFEYPLGGRIFDLALPQRKTLVEFDGRYHHGGGACAGRQIDSDAKKQRMAEGMGWTVIRVSVKENCVIDPVCLHGVLSKSCS